MKKRVLKFIAVFAMLFMMIGKVNAATCSLEEQTQLRTMAANVNVSYEEVDEEFSEVISADEVSEYVAYYLDIKVYNINSYLRVEMTDELNNKTYKGNYRNIGPDGTITFRRADNSQMSNYTFKVYGTSEDCYGEVLRTIKLTLPKYNYYSERTLCADIPEYYMCQKYITYDIDYNNFTSNVEAYKEKLASQESSQQEGESEDNTSIISKTVTTISKWKYVIVGAIIAVGVVITIIVIKRKRSVL